MIIGDFNVVGVIRGGVPCETDAISLVDADAVLAEAVSCEKLQMIAWRITKRFNVGCAVYGMKTQKRAVRDVRRELVSRTVPKVFRLFVCK
jgi:hypothetical protein